MYSVNYLPKMHKTIFPHANPLAAAAATVTTSSRITEARASHCWTSIELPSAAGSATGPDSAQRCSAGGSNMVPHLTPPSASAAMVAVSSSSRRWSTAVGNNVTTSAQLSQASLDTKPALMAQVPAETVAALVNNSTGHASNATGESRKISFVIQDPATNDTEESRTSSQTTLAMQVYILLL